MDGNGNHDHHLEGSAGPIEAREEGTTRRPTSYPAKTRIAARHDALPKRPDWIKVELGANPEFFRLKRLVRELGLHTVCEEARCPNIYECWAHSTGTFMINGDRCTRTCGFCAVKSLRPAAVDPAEPRHVAEAVRALGLRHAVVTAVNRDDMPDGGAAQFVSTIAEIRALVPGCAVEVLIPDFEGNIAALDAVLDAAPDVLNHNIETVPSLYRTVRPQARYATSLAVLARSAERARAPARDGASMVTKSGLMVGLGETHDEILALLRDLHAVGVEVVTIGQYLSPSLKHLPVRKWYELEEFEALRDAGRSMGFRHVESGPFVRSSYHAHEHVPGAAART